MADVNQIITLGIGTPADIPHFILVGLSPTGPLAEEGDIQTVTGVYRLSQDVTGRSDAARVTGRLDTVDLAGQYDL